MNFVFRKKDVFLPKLYSFYLYQELDSMHSRLQLYILFLLFLSPSLAARASIDFIDAVNIGDDVPIYAHTYFHWEKDHRLKIDEVISSLENGKDRDSSEGEFWHSFDTHQARPFAQTPNVGLLSSKKFKRQKRKFISTDQIHDLIRGTILPIKHSF